MEQGAKRKKSQGMLCLFYKFSVNFLCFSLARVQEQAEKNRKGCVAHSNRIVWIYEEKAIHPRLIGT